MTCPPTYHAEQYIKQPFTCCKTRAAVLEEHSTCCIQQQTPHAEASIEWWAGFNEIVRLCLKYGGVYVTVCLRRSNHTNDGNVDSNGAVMMMMMTEVIQRRFKTQQSRYAHRMTRLISRQLRHNTSLSTAWSSLPVADAPCRHSRRSAAR